MTNIRGKDVNLIVSALIVDDDPEVRRMLSSILEDEGYSVEAVDSGSALGVLRLSAFIGGG